MKKNSLGRNRKNKIKKNRTKKKKNIKKGGGGFRGTSRKDLNNTLVEIRESVDFLNFMYYKVNSTKLEQHYHILRQLFPNITQEILEYRYIESGTPPPMYTTPPPPVGEPERRGSAGSRRGSAGSRRGSAGSRRGSAGSRRGSRGSRRSSSASASTRSGSTGTRSRRGSVGNLSSYSGFGSEDV